MTDAETKLIATMDLRFTSGNDIPVERAYLRANEWQLLKGVLTRRDALDKQRLLFIEAWRNVSTIMNRLADAAEQDSHDHTDRAAH